MDLQRHPRTARWADVASLVVFGLGIVVALSTWRDYGMAYDEHAHMEYGDTLYRFFSTWGEDRSAIEHRANVYGPGYDLFGAIVREHSPFGRYETMRLVGAFTGLLGLIAAHRLGSLLGGPLAGLLSMVLLGLTPVYYGHVYSNAKDLPFAAAYLWSMYLLARISEGLPKITVRSWLTFGFAVGIAMSIRIGGLMLMGYAVAVVVLHLLEHLRARPGLGKYARHSGWALFCCVVGLVLAYGIMVALWPWAQEAPLENPLASVRRFSNYTLWRGTTLYDGKLLTTDRLPRDYLVRYFVYQMPEAVLLLFAVGAAWIVGSSVVAPFRRRPLPLALGALLVSAVAPPALIILRDVIVYDGIRHVLFIVPVVCVIAGIAAARFIPALFRKARVAAIAVSLVLALLTTDTLRSMIELHPYEYIHYNHLLGGYAAAEGRWDTDYYARSYREVYELLAEHLWRTERDEYLRTTYFITGTAFPLFHVDQSTDNFQFRPRRGPNTDFFVSYSRHRLHLIYPRKPIIVRVKRAGAAMNYVRDLRSPAPR